MCYSIAYLEKKAKKLAERYKDFFPSDWSEGHEKFADDSNLPVYYFVSGFSHPQLPVIKQDGLHLHQWGLIPFWSKDTAFADSIRSKTLNAKGETVFEKPSFRSSIVSKRCLLPVSGFFEWREVNKVKLPYFIKLRDDELFSLGCLYESWTDRQTGEVRDTFSIITTAANPLMEKIHNVKKRMPLIIAREDETAWVDPSLGKTGIRKLIKPYYEGGMLAYPVSRFLNNPRNERNVPEALKAVVYDDLDLN